MHEDVLEVSNARAGYGELEVLHGIALRVQAGEFLALLGPNGSGKTTFLNAIAGHLRLSEGTITVFGDGSSRAPNRLSREGLAYIADDRQLFPNLTVDQTLRLVPGARQKAVEFVPELDRLRGRRVRLLSGGEQQMLAVARALAAKPRLIVIDELSQGLAPIVSNRLLGILRKAADDGAAVVVVEQSVENVLKVADRGTVLRRGEIIDDRTADAWLGAQDELAEIFLS
jgi:branched-chain amino acid transport system ATP-binding protein